MADVKISALPAVSTPASTDQFAVNQGGTTKRQTRAQIHTLESGETLNATAGTFLAAAGTFTSFTLGELSSDPSDPSEGSCILWVGDGTGTGDDGDVIIKGRAGGVVKTSILFDHSAGA